MSGPYFPRLVLKLAQYIGKTAKNNNNLGHVQLCIHELGATGDYNKDIIKTMKFQPSHIKSAVFPRLALNLQHLALL